MDVRRIGALGVPRVRPGAATRACPYYGGLARWAMFGGLMRLAYPASAPGQPQGMPLRCWFVVDFLAGEMCDEWKKGVGTRVSVHV